MLNAAVLSAVVLATAPTSDAARQDKVKALFEEWCTTCHDSSDDLNLEGDLLALVGKKSSATDKTLVVAGDPKASYLLVKMTGQGEYEGDLMPAGDDPLPPAQVKLVSDWIESISTGGSGGTDAPTVSGETPDPSEGEGDGDGEDDGGGGSSGPRKASSEPFHGTVQIVLPTTTTLGKKTLQYHIDHRFGRIGTERGFLGLDAGVIMSIGIAYGILDGWDVLVRRTNSLKGWEFGTKYVPLRQEAGMPLSLGFYVSMDVYAAQTIANRVSGNFLVMLSRLWFDRWSTELTFSYHLPTNHNTNPQVDFNEIPNDAASPVRDRRGTLAFGIASTVWLGKRKRWGIDLEYLQPIPDNNRPMLFYYRGGDADPDPDAVPIGAWSLGGSYSTGKHFFQVFFSNNRQIHLNQAAPGGQSVNPFGADANGSKNPFRRADFYLGFNLERRFVLGKNAARWKKEREAKKKKRAAEAVEESESEGTEEETDEASE